MVRHFGISHLATMAVKSQLVIGVSSTYRSGSGAVSQGQRTDPVMVAPDFKRVLHNTSTAASHLFAIWKQAVSLLGQREAAIVSRHRNQTHDLAIKHRCHGRCRTLRSPRQAASLSHSEAAFEATSRWGNAANDFGRRDIFRGCWAFFFFFYQKVVKCFTAALLLTQKAAGVVRIVGLCRSVCMQVHPVLFASEIITK